MNKHPVDNAAHPRHSGACRNPVTEYLNIWTTAQVQKTTGRGKSTNNQSIYGIKKLRELILKLAVRGKLVEQDPSDEPASKILIRIASEKERLLKECRIKKQKVLPNIEEIVSPFDIPGSWEWSRIGEITSYGLTDKVEAADVNSDTWVLELEDVEKETSRLLKKVRYEAKPFRSTKNIFLRGDVIYGKLRPYLDKVLVADEDGVCTTEMIPFHAFASVTPRFLRLVLKSPYFIRYANESTHGMNLPRLGTEKARLALIPVVPEAEQHRIVAKVDELMALCDQLEQQQTNSNATHQTLVKTLLASLTHPTTGADGTETNAIEIFFQHFDTLFTTEESIDQLKQTILQLAVMGKLVPQDPDDEPANTLLHKIVNEKTHLIKTGEIKKQKLLPEIDETDTQVALPQQWEVVRFGALINLVSGQHLKSGEYEEKPLEGMIPYLTGPAEFGNNYPNPTRFTGERRAVARGGDILITCKGSGVGKLNLARMEIAISRQLMSIQPIFLPTKYCKLLAESLNEVLRENTVGIAIPGISREDVTEAVVHLPPLAEQHRIVAKVNKLMALCDALKAQLSDAQATQFKLANTIGNQVAA